MVSKRANGQLFSLEQWKRKRERGKNQTAHSKATGSFVLFEAYALSRDPWLYTAENNESKSVTDCFKCGLALSALPLAPENCLALFPRATHLIKHARAPPALRTSLILCNLPFSAPLSHAHSRIEHTPKSSITRTCNTYLTQIHVLHGFCFPFPFPLLFPLVTLQHLSTALFSSLFRVFAPHREPVSLSSFPSSPPLVRTRSVLVLRKKKRREEGLFP